MPIGNEQNLSAALINDQLAALIARWDQLAADSARYAQALGQLGAEGLQAGPIGLTEQDAADHLDVAGRLGSAAAAWQEGQTPTLIRARGLVAT